MINFIKIECFDNGDLNTNTQTGVIRYINLQQIASFHGYHDQITVIRIVGDERGMPNMVKMPPKQFLTLIEEQKYNDSLIKLIND